MQYDFETPVNRRHTASLKWDKYKATDILPFWVADMDFNTAPEIQQAIQDRMSHGVYGYTIPSDDVTQSVVDYLARDHGYEIDPGWIMWTPGVVPALNLFCRAFGDSGSSVMTATPVYPPFLTAPRNSERNLIAVDLMWDGGRWTFDFEKMEASITPDTRSFILCNPHNPVGRVFDNDELSQLADFCVRHDLVLCTDEIHSDLIIEPGIKHTPTHLIGNEIGRRSIMLSSPSKTYNLPGLCCAYAIIEDPKIRTAFRKVARGIITEINAFWLCWLPGRIRSRGSLEASINRIFEVESRLSIRVYQPTYPANKDAPNGGHLPGLDGRQRFESRRPNWPL